MSKEITLHGGGLLQPPKQLEKRESSEQTQLVRPEMIREFCRALIQSTGSDDLIYLAAHAAKHRTKGSDREMRELLNLIWAER
tara:strand:+ start:324 stop:572 length:249 start_codon:yes stop_codon:yes gene_type:complete